MTTVAEIQAKIDSLKAAAAKLESSVEQAEDTATRLRQLSNDAVNAAVANPGNTVLKQKAIDAQAAASAANQDAGALKEPYIALLAESQELEATIASTTQTPTSSTTDKGVTQPTFGPNNTAVEIKSGSDPVADGYSYGDPFQDAQASLDQQVINVDPYVIPTINAQTGEITTEGTTINPASDPGIRPGTQIFDDGSTLYTNPTTGEIISTSIPDVDGKVDVKSTITIPTKAATDAQEQNTGTSTLPIRDQQSGIGSPKDWRFRISLAPGATYLYKDSSPGILKPLMATNGVIFPYSPQINLAYTASYNATDLVHTNYKVYNYKSSSVENINITGDFTVQDSAEANYVLAVIHFFRSVTKMFYGQDQNPARGVPPPLCYLTGFGQYQFDMHPVAITSFTYTFPNDVDYVNAYPTNNSVSIGGQNMAPYMPQIASFFSPLDRLRTLAGNLGKGGTAPPPTFVTSKNINEVTRVPAKITIQLSCIPIVSRNTMSNQFSLKQYANGSLLKGTANFSRTGGGLW